MSNYFIRHYIHSWYHHDVKRHRKRRCFQKKLIGVVICYFPKWTHLSFSDNLFLFVCIQLKIHDSQATITCHLDFKFNEGHSKTLWNDDLNSIFVDIILLYMELRVLRHFGRDWEYDSLQCNAFIGIWFSGNCLLNIFSFRTVMSIMQLQGFSQNRTKGNHIGMDKPGTWLVSGTRY